MDQPNSKPRTRRRGVKRSLCAALFVSAVIIGFAAYRHYSDPQRIRGLAEDFLERITQRKVHVASASFSLRHGVNLRDVFVSNEPLDAEPAKFPAKTPEEIFSCDEISILYNPWALLGGKLKIESFAAIQPTLTLVHDSQVGWDNVSELVRSMISRQKSTGSAPPIELRQARVKIVHRSPAGDRDVEDFHLTVRGRRAVEDPRLFNVVWQDGADPDANGHTQIDLVTGHIRNVRGGLPTMSVRGVMLAVDAGYDGADALTDLLGIEGRVRIRDYNLMQPPLHDGPRSATIDLKRASISIPISQEERSLKIDDRYLRFADVNGSVTMTASTLKADFNALFHGSQCRVTATVDGPLKPGTTIPSLMINAQISAKSLDLPDRSSPQQRRFVERWPQMAKFFDIYDPHGKIDLDFRIEKAPGENEKFHVREALFAARGGDASYHKFPYRVRDLAGAVEFGADGLFVRSLCGRHDSARVCVNGWMEAPHRTALARISVSGANVPIEEELLAALDLEERRWVDEFGLEGDFDATVSLSREQSANAAHPAPWDTVIELTFDDLSAAYAKVPLPVTQLAGQATLHRDRLEISGVRGALGAGSIELHGLAGIGGGGLQQLFLQIAVDGLNMDQSFFRALPAELAAQIAQLQLSGCISTQSNLQFAPATGWRHQTDAQLRNLELTPDAFPLPVDRGLADLQIESDHVEVVRARGFYKDAELFAKGRIGLGDNDEFDIVLEADALPIDHRFKQAAPPRLRDALSDWNFLQPLDAEIRISRPGAELDWNGRAEIVNGNVHHTALPLPFENVQAAISFSEGQAHCSLARARYAGAELDANFSFTREGAASQGKIRIGAKGLPLDDSVRDALPPDAQRVWDKISPTGRMDLTLNDLNYDRADQSQPAIWSVRGQAIPDKVTLAGDDVTIDQGTIHFEGMLADRLGGVTLNGNLHNAAFSFYGQPLTETSANWYLARTAAGVGRAAVRELHGNVHGGTATTQAQLQFDRQKAQYRLATSIQNVQLAPWLESWRARNPAPENQSTGRPSDKPSDIRGIMDAQLHLTSLVDQPQSRTGGGRVEIREGYIYKLPIFLAILNVLDLTVPNNDVLSEASGQFYVTGNSVRLADIDITGESLSLIGTGTMSLSNQSVDLTFVNAGAGRLAGVPVLAELWEGASREMVEIRVTGPVSKPQVRTSPFRGVTDEFKKLFQKRKPRRNVQTAQP